MIALILWGCPTQPPPPPPDVLLVVMDTVRADATSAYGYTRPTTPQLAALAAGGARFDAAVSPGSWTWPTHGSLFTGRWPWEHGAHFTDAPDALHVGEDLQIGPLSPDLPTLAERFSAAGYRSILLSANPIIGPGSGMERGFDVAEAMPDDAALVARAEALLAGPEPVLLVANLFSAHAPFAIQPTSWNAPHEALFADPSAAPAWLAPFLLPGAVRLFARPTPAELPGVLQINRGDRVLPPEGLTLLRDLYDGEVMATDYHLSRLIAAVRTQRGGNPIIAVTADHGELLGEGGLVDHGRLLTPELIDVPLVLSGPGIPAGTVVSQPVVMHALHPTLLDAAGIEQGADGSLLPVLQGATPSWPAISAAWADPYWAAELGGRFAVGYRSLRQADRLLIRAESGASRLLDVSGPVAIEVVEPERSAEMEAMLLAASPDLAEFAGAPRTVSDEMREQLRVLGYVE
ncbi:MAG: arylsulfatase A-like enzyme [Myxococcota bacterium]|jgi:arylsulfatase A-like enzyme